MKTFKTIETSDAFEGLNINDDDLDEEYDFMDESDDGTNGRTRQRGRAPRQPKLKYMQLLQAVADRKRDNVLIELDDLDEVWFVGPIDISEANFRSMRNHTGSKGKTFSSFLQLRAMRCITSRFSRAQSTKLFPPQPQT